MVEARIEEPIVVTGATGFIGRRIIDRLVSAGYAPRALVLPGEAVPRAWAQGVEIARGDVTDQASVEAALQGSRTVVHLAAIVGDWGAEELHQRVTVDGTAHVLRATAANGGRALLASSVVVYGDAIGRDVCSEEHPHGRALGPYSRSKQAQERVAQELEASQSLRVTIIRPANVYGPGSAPWVDSTVAQLRGGGPCLVGGGKQNAGLIYVDNLVDLFLGIAANPATVGRTYNACDDLDVTWKRYFSDLAELCGAPRPKSIPRFVASIAASLMECSYRLMRREQRPDITHEALNLIGSNHRVPIGRARADVGFEPLVDYDAAMTAIATYIDEVLPKAPARTDS